jgi:hypothetical protein
MITTQQFFDRVLAFCSRFALSRGDFGRLSVDDRDFVRDLELGRVGLRRLNKAHDFMSRIEANPASLEKLRQTHQDGAGAGVALGAGEGLEGAAEGESSHERNLDAHATARHREKLPLAGVGP